MIELTTQQQVALDLFREWYPRALARDPAVRPGFVVMGLGGTGKTWLARLLADAVGLMPSEVAGAALQASAAENLADFTGWKCQTLHLWNFKVDARIGGPTMFHFNPESEVRGYKLFVVDEISRITTSLWNATVRHGVPLLVLGDHGQLKPPSNDPADPPIVYQMVPDVVLTEIRRQDRDSPIIHWSMQAREGRDVPYGEFYHPNTGELEVRKVPIAHLTVDDYMAADAMLVWTNKSRMALNHAHRRRLGFSGDLPEAGERVVCRKNQKQYGLLNAFTGRVLEAGKDAGKFSYTMTFRINNTKLVVPGRKCSKKELGHDVGDCPPFLSRDLSDIAFGYAETVDSYIGRQADNVIVFDERRPGDGRAEWLYTALSRARKKVVVATL